MAKSVGQKRDQSIKIIGMRKRFLFGSKGEKRKYSPQMQGVTLRYNLFHLVYHISEQIRVRNTRQFKAATCFFNVNFKILKNLKL